MVQYMMIIMFVSVSLQAGTTVPATTTGVSARQAGTAIPVKKTGDTYEVTVNSSLPLTGEMSVLGNQVVDGTALFFNKLRMEKKRLSCHYNVLDDAFETVQTKKNVHDLGKQSPLFLSMLGTRTVLATKASKIVSLFPLEGALANRKPESSNIVFFRPSYTQEIAALIDYAINVRNKKKIGIFYEASDSGEDALAATKQILAKYGLELYAQAWYPAQSLNVTKAAEEIANKAPNAIICVAKSRPAYNFVRQVINKGLHKTLFLGLSGLVTVQHPLQKSRGVTLVTSQVVPDPVKSDLQIAQEYRADSQKYMANKPFVPYAFEAYINAALLYELLKITPQPFTTEGMMTAVQSLKHVQFKGLDLRFDPQTRTLSSQVYINTGDAVIKGLA